MFSVVSNVNFIASLGVCALTELTVGATVPRHAGTGVASCSLGGALSAVHAGVGVTGCVLSCSQNAGQNQNLVIRQQFEIIQTVNTGEYVSSAHTHTHAFTDVCTNGLTSVI